SLDSMVNISVCANKNEIFYLDVEANRISIKDTEKYIKKAIKYCETINKELEKIPSKNKRKVVNGDLKYVKNEIINNDFSVDLKSKFNVSYDVIRKSISAKLCNENKRIDTRNLNEIREINVEKGPVNKVNSTIFSRGETTVLGLINYTSDKINIGDVVREEHNITSVYNFHGFCVGSMVEKRGNKRELGHANLIKSAFQKLIKNNINLRTYAEVLSSNGSSSMASVCAISVAGYLGGIFDELIAGISLGVFREKNKDLIIVDMNAIEDQYSEMDWKVCGNGEWISSIRVDTKSYILVKSLGLILEQSSISLKELVKKNKII
ncbi:MAG: hypothetical protein ACK5XN_32700, partial [Bacteroidota bacterium]